MWGDSSKDRFFDAIKEAVSCGAQPDEMMKELEHDYYLALDDIKKAAIYTFSETRARRG